EDYTPTLQDIKDYFNANPYHLTYQLATPVIEPVTVEGDLSIQGMAQVEVGEGVVVREVVEPSYISEQKRYYINRITPKSTLENKANRLVAVYKNGKIDENWVFSSNEIYFGEGAYIGEDFYDPTAEYTVTYTVLDKHQ